jgi:hypothetical protein
MAAKVTVDEFMQHLEHPFKAEVQAVRSVILKADRRIQERIKWNAPSFYYLKDLAAFNLRAKGFVQLVLLFPYGVPEDPDGLLEGEFKDRRWIKFYSVADVKKKSTALKNIVRQWAASVEQQGSR